jgi:hypothetical protein
VRFWQLFLSRKGNLPYPAAVLAAEFLCNRPDGDKKPLDAVTKNPYLYVKGECCRSLLTASGRLLQDRKRSVSFAEADKLALQLSVGKRDQARLTAAILESLVAVESYGHCGLEEKVFVLVALAVLLSIFGGRRPDEACC